MDIFSPPKFRRVFFIYNSATPWHISPIHDENKANAFERKGDKSWVREEIHVSLHSIIMPRSPSVFKGLIFYCRIL